MSARIAALELTAALPRFRALIARRFGLQFDAHQDERLAELLGRRAAANDAQLYRYLDALERAPDPLELGALAAELTVGETYFFRHREQFEALRLAVLPELCRARGPGPLRRLRALSAGCASGEEPYSLAICLRSLPPDLLDPQADWSITAIDLNPRALAQARQARYGEWSLRGLGALERQQWFRRVGDRYETAMDLRAHVAFEQRHLAADDPLFWAPGAFDVIFCRNVLMYLEPQALRAAASNLERALAGDGALFLGHAESARGCHFGLEPVHAQGCFYYRHARAAAPLPSAPAMPAPMAPPISLPAPLPAAAQPAPPELPELPKVAPDAADAADAPAPRARLYALIGAELQQEALALAEQLAAAAPRDAELLLARAALQAQSGAGAAAERLCLELLALRPGGALAAAARHVQALSREQGGDLNGAEQAYRQAARLDPGFALPHLRLALLARRRGATATMRRAFRQAALLLPGEDERRLLLLGGGFGRAALLSLCGTSGGKA